MEEQRQKWRAREAQMRDNPKGGELNLAENVRRRCRKNSYGTNVSLPQRGGLVHAHFTRGGPK